MAKRRKLSFKGVPKRYPSGNKIPQRLRRRIAAARKRTD